jgi:RNA polymerase sigma-70 factor (ECF subfamily)
VTNEDVERIATPDALNPDAQLLERLKRREPQAMAVLYDRFKRLVYSIIYHSVREQGVAEDLT